MNSKTSFDEMVRVLGLSSPEEYLNSIELKKWVLLNKDHKYVPLDLLEAWGFAVDEASTSS